MNRRAKSGMSDLIRGVLADAGVPLNIGQIIDALPAAGVDRDAVSALLSQRKKAGEFAMQIVDGKAAYSLVAGYVMARVGSKAGVPKPRGASAAAVDAPAPASPAEAPPTTPVAPPPLPAAAPNPVLRPAAKAKPLTAFGLLDRLDAIAVDVEDVIGDAIDQAVAAQVIKALVAASGGLRRAVHLIHRS